MLKFMFWNKTKHHHPPHPFVWLMVTSCFCCSPSGRRLWLSRARCSPPKQRDKNPADKSSKHWVPLRAWVMADASAHMTAASSADADGAEMPNVTFSECHITSGLDVTRWHYAGAWKGCSAGETWWRTSPWWQTCGRGIILIDVRRTGRLWMAGEEVRASIQGEDVELVVRQLALFFSALTGDKVLRQLTPTGIIIPIIKQFSKHIRNPSIKS